MTLGEPPPKSAPDIYIYIVNKKRDVGMSKCFSKKYGTRDKLSTTCNPKIKSRCHLSVPNATSLHHCLQNHCQYCTRRPLACPSPLYPASVVLFQLHGGIVSHMQVLPTPSSILNTWILTTKTILVVAAYS